MRFRKPASLSRSAIRAAAPYLQWLVFNPSAIEPAMMDAKFPRRESPPPTAIGYRDLDTLLDIVTTAVTPGPYLMGEQFTAADVVIGSALRFGMMPQRKEIADYVARLTARPAFQRAEAKDKTAKAEFG